MKTGTEDKKKVIILAVLAAIALPIGIWELHGLLAAPSTPQPPVTTQITPATTSAANAANGPEAEKMSVNSVDPTLHLNKLTQSEDVDYHGTGRNIFSADSAPIKIERLAAPPRPNKQTAEVVLPPPPPQAPPIELKYFGYSQDGGKAIKAFLVHGDDIFMAKSGEVIDHRYRVGSISPVSVQVTDLSYNNTQNLPISAN